MRRERSRVGIGKGLFESGDIELNEIGSVRPFPDAVEASDDLYRSEPKLRDLTIRLSTLPRWLACGLIRIYQSTGSKMLPGNTCRFYPSCSHYMYQAVYKYGAVRGALMGVWRILRCNPFNPGGFDPVP